MNEIMRRLKQRSTWMGIFAILGAFGLQVESDLAEAIIATGMGIIGIINVAKKD